jgi:hypothetical protein
VSPAIRYFAERTAIPRFFQVHLGAHREARIDMIRSNCGHDGGS